MPKDHRLLVVFGAVGTRPINKFQQQQEQSSDTLRQNGNKTPNTRKPSHEFIAGWTAAFVNTTTLFPINKLIFRQMAGGFKAQTAAYQMRREGLRYLYRGILPPLMQKMISVSIMFGSFNQYKSWTDERFSTMPSVLNMALAACLTGSTEAILTPLERIQMLLQDRSYHHEYKNTIDALVRMRHHGLKEYYRGLTCVLLRNGPSNFLFFGLRDEVKKLMFRLDFESKSKGIRNHKEEHHIITTANHSNPTERCKRKRDLLLYDFLTGATLGMIISTIFYPLSVVRTHMQTRAPGTKFLSIVQAFDAVYSERQRKFPRLFHGCLINVMRQFMSWGIINCCYELALDVLRELDY